MSKIRVDIEVVKALKNALDQINKIPLNEIQFYKNGKPIKMKNLEEFRLTGLNNIDYILCSFYKVKSIMRNTTLK